MRVKEIVTMNLFIDMNNERSQDFCLNERSQDFYLNKRSQDFYCNELSKYCLIVLSQL